MASGGNDRQTGTVPKSKVRNNCNVPQEVVTPTRRDIHSTHMISSAVDWLPVSEHNSRSSQNRQSKTTNAPLDNEYTELGQNFFESSTGYESSRFVPVRPQPRTLVLRRDALEAEEAHASPPGLRGHSPHASPLGLGGHSPHAPSHAPHAAVMVVNPTTPNQHANSSGGNSRNGARGFSVGRDGGVLNNNAGGGPHSSHPPYFPGKTNNVSDGHDMVYQNGSNCNGSTDNFRQNHQDHPSHGEAARCLGESLVAACPDTARVEQRLGQIREYIRVTSTLVDSMRNSEDELRQRLISLRHSNDMLSGEVSEEPEPQPDADDDLAELMVTLSDLKDSEKKLEQLLRTTLDTKDYLDEEDIIGVAKIESPTSAEKEEPADNLQAQEVTICEITEQDSAALQETLPRPSSVQSSGSGYSDNDLWQNELKTNIEMSKVRLSASLQDQKRLLKYQVDAKELAEMNFHCNEHPDVSGSVPPEMSLLQAPRTFASNQIGVATTLPHNSDSHTNNNSNRGRGSSSHERERNERSSSNFSEPKNRGIAAPLPSSEQAELDMLRDLKIRRQQLESQILQVVKIQNLHAATTSPPASATWASEESAEDEVGTRDARETRDPRETRDSLHSKMAAVNVMKEELQRLKSMLRTVDSIQSNYGLNTGFEDENASDGGNTQNEQQSRRVVSQRGSTERSYNNAAESPRELPSAPAVLAGPAAPATPVANKTRNAPLPRLQNCISTSSRKCTNVSERQNCLAGDVSHGIGTGLVAIQQLTQQLKQEAHAISEERRRLKHSTNREACTSSGSSIKSEDKKRNSAGPVERHQQALRADLEAKKRQLERLMSKEVDHRTNQQTLDKEAQGGSKTIPPEEALPPTPASHTQRLDVDNGYSSDQDEDETYAAASRAQVNINQSAATHKIPSMNSSPENCKNAGYYESSARSPDDSFLPQNVKHNRHQRPRPATGSVANSKPHNREPSRRRESHESVPVAANAPTRKDFFSASPVVVSPPASPQVAPKPTHHPQATGIEVRGEYTAFSGAGAGSGGGSLSDLSRPDLPLPHLPPPMAALSLRRPIDTSLPEALGGPSPLWGTSSESQVALWWHNRTNQLQQQLEATSNLCQALLQERRGAEAWWTPPIPPVPPVAVPPPHCLQQLLHQQQREIVALRHSVATLEERFHTLHADMSRAQSPGRGAQYWPPPPPHPALNNQVPPGNRANNYWDNFRSYSRQNLLSGNSKSNADPAMHGHNPHPLVERSRNTLASAPPPANTPKRNVNSLIHPASLPSRTNLFHEAYLTAPPDVLNVNQNLDLEPNLTLPVNTVYYSDDPSVARSHSLNLNVNRLDENPIPEIVQAHSNNLDINSIPTLPVRNGALKKKSSSKLPAKNASNAGNYSLEYVQNRTTAAHPEFEISSQSNLNLASSSSTDTQEKSTVKLFDLLRENVYSEVTALISANESRPHFLIQLFRDLRQISSDTQRQRTLQSIQELVSHYLSVAETESLSVYEDPRGNQRVSSTSDSLNAVDTLTGEPIISASVDSEIARFISAHRSDVCTPDLLDALRNTILSVMAENSNRQNLDRVLRESLSEYAGSRLIDVSDDLILTLSRLIPLTGTKVLRGVEMASDSRSNTIDNSEETGHMAPHSYSESPIGEVHFGHSGESAIPASRREVGVSRSQSAEAQGVEEEGACGSVRYQNCDSKLDLIESVETYNGDLAEADQSRHGSEAAGPADLAPFEAALPDVVDTEEQTPTEAEAEWLGLDRVPTRLQTQDSPGNQSDASQP